MSYNWNVYKIFKNGKRAKAPLAVFECEEGEIETHFEKEFKAAFNSVNHKYKIIRSDLSQEREVERVDREKLRSERLKIQALSKLLRESKVIIPKGRSVGAALIFSADTGWNWQWAAIEKGTSNYIQGLSPAFETYKEAETWIENLISSKT